MARREETAFRLDDPLRKWEGPGKTGRGSTPFQRYFVSQLTIVTRKKYKHMWLSRQRFFTRFSGHAIVR
jgi:hypothetical protein